MHQAGTENVTLAIVIQEGVVFNILRVFFIAFKLRTSVKILLEMKFCNLIFNSFKWENLHHIVVINLDDFVTVFTNHGYFW